MMQIVTTSIPNERYDVTVIHVSDYVRYAELNNIEEELEEAKIAPFVVLSGKMPSWYSLGITAHLMKMGVKVLGIFRPPAKKVLVVWSEDPSIIGEWIELPKRLTEFCISGEYYT